MAQRNPQLLTDIRLRLAEGIEGPLYAPDVDRRRIPNHKERQTDLGKVGGRDNLAQAIVLRLLTPRGELAPLGHPEYGSRLHELIGRRNTETVRNLARLHILETLSREPRVDEVEEARVELLPGLRVAIRCFLRVRPIGAADSVTVGPITLDLDP